MVRYLENCSSQKEFKYTVSEELKLSSFLLKKMISEVNKDFQSNSIETKIIINHVNIELVGDKRNISDKLELLLLEQSTTFSIVVEICFERFNSIYDYSWNNFMSYSSVYKKLNDIRKYLKAFDFTITKDFKFKGNEKKIRLFLFYLFDKIYSLNFDIYPQKLQKETNIFLVMLENFCGKPLKEHSKIKLYHFFSITLLRIEQRNFLKNDTLHISEESLLQNDYFYLMNQYFQNETLNLPQEHLIAESDELLGFMVAKKIILADNYLECANNQLFKVYSFNFMNTVKKKYPHLTPYIEMNEKKIDLIHFNAFNFISLNYQKPKNIDFKLFLNRFPEYVIFCESFIKCQNEKMNKLHQFFFHTYILILINADINQVNSLPIYLYVDFSSDKTTELMTDIIKKFMNFKIIYQDFVDKKTEIILSDTYFEKYNNVYQIVWKEAPQADDWGNFISGLELLKKVQ